MVGKHSPSGAVCSSLATHCLWFAHSLGSLAVFLQQHHLWGHFLSPESHRSLLIAYAFIGFSQLKKFSLTLPFILTPLPTSGIETPGSRCWFVLELEASATSGDARPGV